MYIFSVCCNKVMWEVYAQPNPTMAICQSVYISTGLPFLYLGEKYVNRLKTNGENLCRNVLVFL